MKVSFNWLKDLIEFSWAPEQAAHILGNLGFEVASITRVGGEVTGIVTARILEVKPHPNADRLSVCKVTDGKETLTIVCGAKNIAPGQTVPLARPGTILPGGQKIEKAVIRGAESSGMLCSERELGLSEDHAGILILDDNGKLGKQIKDVLPLSDTILDVEVTPNRPDCLSHLGIARELSAISGKRLKPPHLYPLPRRGEEFKKYSSPPRGGRGQGEGGGFPIQIENPEDCPRYIGTVIHHISIKPSPLWLARRLTLCGIRPINNVVDITNYVLLELGHSLHAFDLSKLSGPRIIVRKAKAGEYLDALDENRYSLSRDTLVIADEKVPVAIAGVIGGTPTSIQNETHEILLESACFDRKLIRRASKSLGVRTESSYRFERGSHPASAEAASQRALELIVSMAGGKPASQTDTYPKARKPVRVALRPARVNSVLGLTLKTPDIKSRLTALGFSVRHAAQGKLTCETPPWRVDIEGEHDLIEEVARLMGYDKIPSRLPPHPGPLPRWGEGNTAGKQAKQILLAHGFWEACSSSFVSGKMIHNLDPALLKEAVAIQNPLSEEQEYLRPNLCLHLIDSIRKNQRQGIQSLKLFEVGRCFPRDTDESKRLALVLVSDPQAKHWKEKTTSVDFFMVKSWCELLFDLWKLPATYGGAAPVSFLHPGASTAVEACGVPVGWMGLLHPAAAKAMDVPLETGVAEFDLGEVSKLVLQQDTARFRELPKYPPVKRDLSLIVKKSVAWEQVETCVKRSLGGILEKIRPFDVFSGGHLETGEKSLAFSVSFRHPDKTLTDQEADELIQKMLKTLKENLSARLRDL